MSYWINILFLIGDSLLLRTSTWDLLVHKVCVKLSWVWKKHWALSLRHIQLTLDKADHLVLVINTRLIGQHFTDSIWISANQPGTFGRSCLEHFSWVQCSISRVSGVQQLARLSKDLFPQQISCSDLFLTIVSKSLPQQICVFVSKYSAGKGYKENTK